MATAATPSLCSRHHHQDLSPTHDFTASGLAEFRVRTSYISRESVGCRGGDHGVGQWSCGGSSPWTQLLVAILLNSAKQYNYCVLVSLGRFYSVSPAFPRLLHLLSNEVMLKAQDIVGDNLLARPVEVGTGLDRQAWFHYFSVFPESGQLEACPACLCSIPWVLPWLSWESRGCAETRTAAD